MMKIITISVIALILCSVAAFPQSYKELSVSDVCGTYYMVRIENLWERPLTEKDKEWFNDFRYLVINESYYILGVFVEQNPYYRVIKKNELPEASNEPNFYVYSEYFGHFSDYPRNFDTIIHTSGYIRGIEVIDYDTIIIPFHNSYILYKRAK